MGNLRSNMTDEEWDDRLAEIAIADLKAEEREKDFAAKFKAWSKNEEYKINFDRNPMCMDCGKVEVHPDELLCNKCK